MAAQPVAERPIEDTNIAGVQASFNPSRQILTTRCHFQKPTALADPRNRLDRARMQSASDPASVQEWAALSSWIRTRLHQRSDRPKPVTNPARCGTAFSSGGSRDSVPRTVT
jgi:hypothetical protein